MLFSTTSDWEFFNITSLLDPGKTLIAFSLYGYEGAGPAEDRTYLDDVIIDAANPIPEPATVLLLGSGLAGLAGLRRKFKKA